MLFLTIAMHVQMHMRDFTILKTISAQLLSLLLCVYIACCCSAYSTIFSLAHLPIPLLTCTPPRFPVWSPLFGPPCAAIPTMMQIQFPTHARRTQQGSCFCSPSIGLPNQF